MLRNDSKSSKKILPLILLILFSLAASAWAKRPYKIRSAEPLLESWRWQKMDELDGEGYRCMAESAEGTMWFGIKDGALAFDGVYWTRHSSETGLDGSTVTSIQPAKDKSVYAATSAGIYRYADNRWVKIFPSGQQKAHTSKILEASDGSIWAGMEIGLLHIRNGMRVFYAAKKDLPLLESLLGEGDELVAVPTAATYSYLSRDGEFNITEIAEDAEKHIWLGTNRRLIVRYDNPDRPSGEPEAWHAKMFREDDRASGYNDVQILQRKDGSIWVVSNDKSGINTFDGLHWKTFHISDFVGDSDINCSIIELDNGTVWVGGQGVIDVYDKENWKQYEPGETPIPAASRIDLYKASDGHIWIAGLQQEVFRFDATPNRWLTYHDLNFHCESDDSTQWFISRSGRVVANRGDDWLSYGTEDGLMEAPLKLTRSSRGVVWAAGSHHGFSAVSYFDGLVWHTREFPAASWGVDYRAVLETSDGALWFGSAVDHVIALKQHGGVIHFDPALGVFEDDAAWEILQAPAVDNAPYGIAQWHGVLLTAQTGLIPYEWRNRKTAAWFPISDDRLRERIDFMRSTADGHIWAGSRMYGVFHFDGKSWTFHDQDSGLASNTIIHILPVSHDDVWVCTDKDISHFDGKGWTTNVMPAQMVMSREGGELVLGKDGSIWINKSSRNWKRRVKLGKKYEQDRQEYHTIRYHRDAVPPETQITQFDKQVSQPGNTILSWKGIDPWKTSPTELLQYSYRLNDGPWSNYSPEDHHVFLGLPSGQHTFEVRTRDMDCNVDSTPERITFEVIPPVWRQAWFLSLVGILLSVITIQSARIIKERRKLQIANTQLTHAIIEAESASRAKSDFLANMSHEIRTPMNAIFGMTELAIESRSVDEIHDYLHRVQASSDILLSLINHVLDISKIEAGQIELEAVPFDLHEVVEGVAEMLSIRSASKSIELVCGIAPDVPQWVVGDPTRLRQILTNLGGNAIKFTSAGEVTLIVEPAAATENSHVARLHFSVEDTGIGISEEQRERIFEKFSQADTSTTRRYGGTGLGLSISKSLIEMMGGKLELKSEIDKGSVFHFLLQLPVANGAASASIAATPAKFDGRKVLIVDDNQTNRFILNATLTAWGFYVTEASGGAEALRILDVQPNPFDLILLDYLMPEIDGAEVARLVRENPRCREVKIVMLSSLSGSQMKLKKKLEIAAFITKPVRRSQLLNSINNILFPQKPETASDSTTVVTVTEIEIPRSEKRILLVEDNLDNQILGKTILEKEGYLVHMVENGERAVDAAIRNHYDLILMDIQMPIMDGFTATAKIRAFEGASRRQRVPIVALTANATVDYREECLRKDMDDYMSKPLRKKFLIQKIEQHLAWSPSQLRQTSPEQV